MGMPGPWELIIILAIVALLFGTKKLRNIGGDLGGAVKGFKNAMKEPDERLEHQQTEADKPAVNEQPVESGDRPNNG